MSDDSKSVAVTLSIEGVPCTAMDCGYIPEWIDNTEPTMAGVQIHVIATFKWYRYRAQAKKRGRWGREEEEGVGGGGRGEEKRGWVVMWEGQVIDAGRHTRPVLV